ncbi:MAG TPA: FeoC-like transcriptional regulator [Psychromonas sp.]
MILYSIIDYIKNAGRVEEGKLLKHFHISQQGLEPMMAVLLKRGKIKKTINNRGEKLPPEIYYSWSEKQQIPILTVV